MSDEKTLVVIGDHAYRNRDYVYGTLDAWRPTRVLTGGRPGPEFFAYDWCVLHGVPCVQIPKDEGKRRGDLFARSRRAVATLAFGRRETMQQEIRRSRIRKIQVVHYDGKDIKILDPLNPDIKKQPSKKKWYHRERYR